MESLQAQSVHSQAGAVPSHNVNIGDFEGKDVTVIENQNVDVFGDYPVIVQSDTSTPNVTGVGGDKIEAFPAHVSGGSSTKTSPASSHAASANSGVQPEGEVNWVNFIRANAAMFAAITVIAMLALIFLIVCTFITVL